MVPADFALRMMGLSILDIAETVIRPDPMLFFHDGNQAMPAVCNTGRNLTMRHLHRTHRVSFDWLHEVFARGDIILLYPQIGNARISLIKLSSIPNSGNMCV